MTPKAPTTWIVGAVAVAVIAGVAIAAWRPVMERYWAARFADEELAEEERLDAGVWLAKHRSPLLPAISLALMERPDRDDPGFVGSRAGDVVFAVIKARKGDGLASLFAPDLKRALRDGSDHERSKTARLFFVRRPSDRAS